jgi:uncharacterized membrane protein YozB (DUF420 family)
MNWLALLGIAVVLVAVAAVTGMKPKGTRHVANTRMMGVARIILFFMAGVLLYAAYRARGG